MMLIDTFVATSAIHGIGIFTKEFIKSDSKIWEFEQGIDIILTLEQLQAMPLWKRTYFEIYCYMNDGKLYYCSDNARFMNHSENSNTYEKPDGTYAAFDIEIGQELTCNYANFGITQEDLLFNYSLFINNETNKLLIK